MKKTLYHGTNAEFDEFDPGFLGGGNDQFGAGFYLTDSEKLALGYGKVTVWELDSDRIMGPDWLDSPASRNADAYMRMIRKAPNLEDDLQNWAMRFDDGLKTAFRAIVYNDATNFETLQSIWWEFYRDDIGLFLAAAVAEGIDGIWVRSDRLGQDPGTSEFKTYVIYNSKVVKKISTIKESNSEYIDKSQIIQVATRLYKELNDKLWKGELPEVTIKTSLSAKVGATTLAYRNKKTGVITNDSITVSTHWLWTEQNLRGVMAHEMVHVWQNANDKNDTVNKGHGYNFRQELKRINQLMPELNAPEEHDAPVNSDRNVKLSAMVFMKTNGGVSVITCFQKDLERIKEETVAGLRNAKKYTNVGGTLYVLKDAGPEYSAYPKSVKKLKFFVADKSLLDKTKSRVEEEVII